MSLIRQYIEQSDWRIKENSNMAYSYPGMLGYVVGHETAKFALQNIYSAEIAEAHKKAFIHIHDLNGLCPYCYGMDLEMLFFRGLDDIEGAAKHFSSAMAHMSNAAFLISQQINGALAFNSPDILTAPYIANDDLTYKQVKQIIQEFVYTINIKGRIGYQSPFINFQLDVTVPKRLRGHEVIIAGQSMGFTYDDCRNEIHWFNRALLETLMEAKNVKAFPVINVGITKEFDWNSKFAKVMFESIGKIGQPVINNYVNSDYDPDSVKSMCCSLRLDMSKLQKQAGGQFGAADNSGSLGVVTLNLPRYGFIANGNKDILFELIDNYMELADKALVAKRYFVEEMHKKGMYPTVRRFVPDFRNFFNTIGDIGHNEMCLNFFGKGIDTEEGYALSLEVAEFMNKKLSEFQIRHEGFYGQGTSLFYNRELVPGEGTTHRFALHDKKIYGDKIITANATGADYYTRGVWLPADKEYNLVYAMKHQELLQDKYSGGANFNLYVNEPIHDPKAIKSLVKKIVNNTTLPFISISPTISVCPVCGVKTDTADTCEHDLTDEQYQDLKERGLIADG